MTNQLSILQAAAKLSQLEKIDLIKQLFETLSTGGRSFLKHDLQSEAVSLSHGKKPKANAVYTIAQAARMLNASSSSTTKWFDTGKLRGYRTVSDSQVARIPHDDLAAYLKKEGLQKKIPKRFNQDCVYTSGQAAKIVGVTSKTISRWVKSGKLRGYFIAGTQERRILHSNLVKFAKAEGRELNKAA